VLGIVPTHVQNLAPGLVELHDLPTGALLKACQCLSGWHPSLRCVDCTTQLGVTIKLAEGALNRTVHVIDKDVKQCQSKYQPLRNATRHWSPLGHQTIDHKSLSVTIQPVPYPLMVHPSNPCVSVFRCFSSGNI